MTFNQKIAESLGIALPPEEPNPLKLPVVVEPSEIVRVDNATLPDMSDIDKRMLEGEKQLETIITVSLDAVAEAQETIPAIEPKYRGRFVEAANVSMQIALDAVKTKISTQLDKKEMRMKEAEFEGKKAKGGSGPTGNTTNNIIFTGSQPEMLDYIMNKPKESEG